MISFLVRWLLLPKKARRIRALVLDADGILTSGRLFYDSNGHALLDFHVHDGMGMRALQKAGVAIAVITSRQSKALSIRMHELGITHVWQGQHDKQQAFEQFKNLLHLDETEMACMGDDLPDLPMLSRAGLSVTVRNAPRAIRQRVHWVTRARGGEGAVRELSDLLLQYRPSG